MDALDKPRIVGMLGPQMSMSMMAVCLAFSCAHAQPSMDVNVLLPTPPLPLMIKIFRLTLFIRSAIRGRSGSGPFGVLAHTDWFGQPSHADALPASSDSVPGQWAGAFSGTLSGNARAMLSGGRTLDDAAPALSKCIDVDTGEGETRAMTSEDGGPMQRSQQWQRP